MAAPHSPVLQRKDIANRPMIAPKSWHQCGPFLPVLTQKPLQGIRHGYAGPGAAANIASFNGSERRTHSLQRGQLTLVAISLGRGAGCPPGNEPEYSTVFFSVLHLEEDVNISLA